MNTLKFKKHRQQKGIVLLSCLVLLILILSLLRFMMSTSHLSERRSGVEAEIFTAKQQALFALQMAEQAIICPEKPTGTCNSSDEATREAGNKYWRDRLVDTTKLPEGFFRGMDTGSANDIPRAENACRYIWKCTNWQVGGSVVNNSASFAHRYQPRNIMENSKTIGQYVVEVFPGKAMGLDEEDSRADDIQNVVFRVTAMGFGQVRSGDAVQMTNHLVQADYVFSREE